MTYIRSVLVGVALIATQSVFAADDVTAVYKITAPDGDITQTIRYTDKQHVRVDMVSVNDKATTMMKLGDKVYLITGKWVQDMGQLVEMLATMGKRNKPSRAKTAPIKSEEDRKSTRMNYIT